MNIHIKKEYSLELSRPETWAFFTDFDSDGRNWVNIRDIKTLRREGNVVERTATVGPKLFGSNTKQTITVEPMEAIYLKIHGESMSGDRTIRFRDGSAGTTLVGVEWNIDIRKVPDFVHGIITSQLETATDHAISMAEKKEGGQEEE